MSILVSFLWHMHQPFYKDLARNRYVMPWAYLHATKDYYGMPALTEEFPDIHQTFNLVPSLIVQLEEYSRGEARDDSFDLAFRPVADCSPEDRAAIADQFFPVPVRTMVHPFPRYFELYERKQRSESFSDEDIRDIQVWWTLAWMDQDRRPKDLVARGRHFTEDDKVTLRRAVMETIAAVVPEYRNRQKAGSIEVSTTPFYHPILPILINSRVDDPSVPVDVRIPADAREQLVRARNFMEEHFGTGPRGLWPSEGSVSDDVALMVSEVGFKWMATDEGILAKSGIDLNSNNRRRLYHPYLRHGVRVFFRDRTLSDLIGFHYMRESPQDGARDLIRRLKDIGDGAHVTIALDGENPWDYYTNSGRDFLKYLFDGIRREPSIEAVTLSEAGDRMPAESLNWLAPGSWAGANFQIWIGHPEDHEAWRWILQARESLMGREGEVPEPQWQLAYEELLIAEGSDWMWWFGNDFSSDQDAIFDALFRHHIGNVFRFVGLPLPEGLDRPIKKNLEGRRLVMPPP
jgi:alpha-amylase/alpha-mannosidase (GH57 family)